MKKFLLQYKLFEASKKYCPECRFVWIAYNFMEGGYYQILRLTEHETKLLANRVEIIVL